MILFANESENGQTITVNIVTHPNESAHLVSPSITFSRDHSVVLIS